MDAKTSIFEVPIFCERKPSTVKKEAFLVEISDEDDVDHIDIDTSAPNAHDPDAFDADAEQSIHLPVVIDLKPAGDKNVKKQGIQDGSGSNDEPQIACFTCFLGPCPEVVNANFKHPEFMICYRDGNSRCENGMMRYYCCPLYLASIKKDGEETFELRAVQTDTNVNSQSSGFSNMGAGAAGGNAGNRTGHDWHKYYNAQAHPNLGGIPSHHSFSSHHFNCRHANAANNNNNNNNNLPPQFNFLHHCSCSCPPQMMAYYLNYRFQNAPQQHHHAQPGYRFAYNQNQAYMFPAPGSAMS